MDIFNELLQNLSEDIFNNTNSNFIIHIDYRIGTNIHENIPEQQNNGLNPEQINACSAKLIIQSTTECYICLENLLKGSCMRKLQCSHVFCIDCIDRWFMYHSTCPICKFNFKDMHQN
jgi:Ring finger domain